MTNAVDLIKRFEGLSLKAYKPLPTDVWTIGYGNTTLKGRPVVETDVITRADAERMLKLEVDMLERQVDSLMPGLEPFERVALVSLAYNIGLSALRTSTLLKRLREGDKAGAAQEFMKWTKSGGKEIRGLRLRREAERKVFVGAPAPKPLTQSRTIAGSAIALVGGVANETITDLQPVQYGLQSIGIDATWLGYVLTVLTIAGACWAIYARIDDRRKGRN
jgi:lysozyme